MREEIPKFIVPRILVDNFSTKLGFRIFHFKGAAILYSKCLLVSVETMRWVAQFQCLWSFPCFPKYFGFLNSRILISDKMTSSVGTALKVDHGSNKLQGKSSGLLESHHLGWSSDPAIYWLVTLGQLMKLSEAPFSKCKLEVTLLPLNSCYKD